jgi:hypothetical protein
VTGSGAAVERMACCDSTGMVAGVKWFDANGDHVRQGTEPGLSNWTIQLSPGGMTALTDQFGFYTFPNVAPGIYTVSEVSGGSGWTQTFPLSGTYNITVNPNQVVSNINFGNKRDSVGTICVVKFNDRNGNGVQNSGEEGLADWLFSLTGTYAVTGAITDSTGQYCLVLPVGTYTVSESPQSGWTPTTPTSQIVTLGSGQTRTVVFGNWQGDSLGGLCGMKFNDLNGNGVRDAGEPGISNWRINLTGTATGTVLTDSLGRYCFSNLSPGTYTLAEVLKTGWRQTAPPSPWTYTVTLAPGQTRDSLNFGNKVDSCRTDTLLINTGYNHAVGAVYPVTTPSNISLDNYWHIRSIPGVPSMNQGANVRTRHPAWAVPFANSQWLSSHPFNNVSTNGEYVFEFKFCLGDTLGTPTLSGDIFVDDDATLWLNNHLIGTVPQQILACSGPPNICNHQNSHPFSTSISSNFKTGTNTLTVKVTNRFAVAMGFDLRGVVTGSGAAVERMVCCDSTGMIDGVKWFDGNGDHVRQGNEPGLSNWTIQLSPGGMTAVTDQFGFYTFPNVAPGIYTVSEVPGGSGWTRSEERRVGKECKA